MDGKHPGTIAKQFLPGPELLAAGSDSLVGFAGCMEVLPRSHKEGVFRHYTANLPFPKLR